MSDNDGTCCPASEPPRTALPPMTALTIIAARQPIEPAIRLDDLPTVGPWLWSIRAIPEWVAEFPGARVVFVAKYTEPVDPRFGPDFLVVPVPEDVLARFDHEAQTGNQPAAPSTT